MLISEVQVGDVILEGSGREQSRTKVAKVEAAPNSCVGKTHINEKDCYENFTEVRVQD